ncbi:hypothetical protein PSHT_02883, partial [Puccinia striiformis]
MQFEMVFTFVPPLALLSAGPIIRGSPQAEVIWPLGPSTTPITGSTSGVSYIQQVLGDPSPLQMQNRTIDELSLPQVIKNAPSPSPPPPIALKRKPTRQKRGPNSKVVPLISSAPEPSHSGKPLHKPQLLTTLKQQPGPKKRASKRKVPAVAETAAEPEVVVDNPLFCDCSPEQDLDISKEGFCLTVAKVHEYERLSIADKLKLEKAYQEYQIAIYLIAIENKLQIKPVLEYLGNNTRPHGPTS